MKVIVCKKYGAPEVLQLEEKEKPVPKDNEVLIKIKATVVAPPDIAFREGKPAFIRVFTGLNRPKDIPGDVLSGTIKAIGKNVASLNVGDEVYGTSGRHYGANAEYMTVPQDEALAIKPKNINHGEAAAISEGALTALPFLRDGGKIKKGDKVLINGGSGGVGVYAVQIARYFGAQVIGVCGTRNIDFIRQLGAQKVIDYTKEDFTNTGDTYDIIFDAVAKSSFSKCKKVLSPSGTYLSTVPTPSLLLASKLSRKKKGKNAVFMATGLRDPDKKKSDLNEIRKLIEAGQIIPVIDKKYTLEQISDAHQYVEAGHKTGSVVVVMDA